MTMMQNSIKTLIIILVFTLATSKVTFAQQKQLRGWSEPFFEDNAAEFDAQPGSFEFCTSFGSSPSLFGWRNDLCWEVEAMITKKLGIESGFYTTWLQQPDKSKQTESTRTAIGLQYTLKNTRSEAWAIGIDLLSPGWAPRGQQQVEGWGIKPNIIYGHRWLDGFDSQWRITPTFEISGNNWQFGSTVMGAFFWQNDWLSLGVEVGGGLEKTSFAFVAPQAGIYLGDFSVWLGWWHPTYFNIEKAAGYLSLSLCYNWEKSDM